MSTLLKNARIIDVSSPFHHQVKDILIHDGVIKKIADSIVETKGDKVIRLETFTSLVAGSILVFL